MGRPPEDIDVERVELGAHPHVMIASRSHPLAKVRRIPIGRLADESLLLRERGSGTRILTERLLADAQVQPRYFMEISSNETIKQAVMAGLGIALISGHTIAAEIESGRLAVLDVVGLPVMRTWYLVRHREKRPMPPAAALWDFLVSRGPAYLPAIARPSAKRPGRAVRGPRA
jgi:LysR family transcriptional regulator for metE and metH